MKLSRFYLVSGLATTVISAGIAASPAASADCTNAGAATVCGQGTVRGGGPSAPQAGPVYPGYCADPWYCSDDWGIDVIINPGRPGGGRPGDERPGRPGDGRPGRPGGPGDGRPGGIGPR